MSCIATLLFMVLNQSPLDQKLSYSTNGARVPVILAELSAQTGIKLKSSSDMSNEVLVMRVDGVSMQEILDRVAKATSGEWTASDSTYRLVVDTKARKEEERLYEDLQTQYIRKSLLSVKDLLNPDPPKGEWSQEMRDIYAEGLAVQAERKLLLTLMTSIPAETYASIEDGQRVVFATSPTRMQRNLNMNPYSGMIQDWIKQNNQYVEEMQKHVNGQEVLPPGYDMFMGDWMPKKVETAPTEALFVLSNPDNGYGDINASLGLYDASGKRILNIEERLVDYIAEAAYYPDEVLESSGGVNVDELEAQETEYPIEPGDEVVVKRSEEVMLYEKATGLMDSAAMMSSDLPPLDPKVLEILLRVDIYDPIALDTGDLLVGAAKVRKENLIASLPDDGGIYSLMEEAIEMGMPDSGTSGTTVRTIRLNYKSDEYIDTRKDGWWTIAPSNPFEVRQNRFNRVALTQLLAETRKHLVVPVDVIADYAAYNPEISENYSVMERVMVVCPSLMGGGASIFGGFEGWDSLRLYGRLTTGQRQSFRRGEPIRISILGKDARDQANTMVYGDPGKLETITAESSTADPVSMLLSMSMSWEGSTAQEIMFEPTESAPNGINSGIIQVQASSEPYVVELKENESPSPFSMPMGAMEISFFKMSMEQPEMASEMVNFKLDNLRSGTRTVFNGGIFVRPGLGVKVGITDHQPPDMSQKFTLNSLPPSFAAEVQKQLEAIKKSPFGQMMGGFGGGSYQDPPSQ